MAFDMTLGMATFTRIHHQWMPDMAMVEPGISADTVNILSEQAQNSALKQHNRPRNSQPDMVMAVAAMT